jgi:acetoin utilization deacetylase AcuC-like enzyme
VSVGFDAYWADPLAEMQLTLSGYSHLASEVIRMAQQLCDGKVVFVLEGGYDLDALRFGVGNIARTLLGEPAIDPLGTPILRDEPDIADVVSAITTIHGI